MPSKLLLRRIAMTYGVLWAISAVPFAASGALDIWYVLGIFLFAPVALICYCLWMIFESIWTEDWWSEGRNH